MSHSKILFNNFLWTINCSCSCCQSLPCLWNLYQYWDSVSEIVDLVKKGPEANNGQPLRPSLSKDMNSDDEVVQLMNKCWAEDSIDRPDFATLKNKMHQLNKKWVEEKIYNFIVLNYFRDFLILKFFRTNIFFGDTIATMRTTTRSKGDKSHIFSISSGIFSKDHTSLII